MGILGHRDGIRKQGKVGFDDVMTGKAMAFWGMGTGVWEWEWDSPALAAKGMSALALRGLSRPRDWGGGWKKGRWDIDLEAVGKGAMTRWTKLCWLA